MRVAAAEAAKMAPLLANFRALLLQDTSVWQQIKRNWTMEKVLHEYQYLLTFSLLNFL